MRFAGLGTVILVCFLGTLPHALADGGVRVTFLGLGVISKAHTMSASSSAATTPFAGQGKGVSFEFALDDYVGVEAGVLSIGRFQSARNSIFDPAAVTVANYTQFPVLLRFWGMKGASLLLGGFWSPNNEIVDRSDSGLLAGIAHSTRGWLGLSFEARYLHRPAKNSEVHVLIGFRLGSAPY